MAAILLKDVSVEFPVYNSRTRGLLNTVLEKVSLRRGRRNLASDVREIVGLNGVSVCLNYGDRVGLIGKNGAGKTTLLRVLSGIYEPTRGECVVHGKVSALTDIMLGMDADATGYENIYMRGLFLGFSKGEMLRLIPDVEQFTELGDHLQLPIRTYSSGMLLRLAFAVSTALKPDILLMDEIIGAGDFHFQRKARERLDHLLEAAKILVIASHDENVIKKFCDKVILLDVGRVAFFGDVDEGLARYKAE